MSKKKKPVGWPSINEKEHQRHIEAGLKSFYGTSEPLTKEEIKEIQKKRSKDAKIVDNSKGAKMLLDPNDPRTQSWGNAPNQIDIENVDSKKTKGEHVAIKEYKNISNSIEETNSITKLKRMDNQLYHLYDGGYITEEQYKKTKHRIHEKQYQVSGDKVDSELLIRRRHALGKGLNGIENKEINEEDFEELSDKSHKLDRQYQRDPSPENRKKLEESIIELEKLTGKNENFVIGYVQRR